MWKRIKENAPATAAIATVFVGFAAIVQLGVLNPIQQRMDDFQAAMNQRFDAQDKRIDDLKGEMSQRINNLRAEMNQRFDAQDKRIDDLKGTQQRSQRRDESALR